MLILYKILFIRDLKIFSSFLGYLNYFQLGKLNTQEGPIFFNIKFLFLIIKKPYFHCFEHKPPKITHLRNFSMLGNRIHLFYFC